MTDVQVSNARRIAFTALAVVAFWVLAWRAYWMGCDEGFDPAFPGSIGFGDATSWTTLHRQSLTAVAFALPPAILLSLSVCNSPLKIRDRWMLASSLLLSVATYVCYGIGESDGWAAIVYVVFESGVSESPFYASGMVVPRGACIDAHETSWPWLLLPLILTTAVVIFGAWRRGVRDAEVEVVGEGE